jgi:RimJ/RimL family protein N-acetyltransferase
LYDENDYFRTYEDFKSYAEQDILTFTDYNEEILEKSWGWLNDPEIKKLTNSPEFTREDQKKWFYSLANNSSYYIKGLSLNNMSIGVAGLKKINNENNDAEYFGYIGEKQFWGKGLSRRILSEMVLVAKKEFKLKHLYLNVIPENIRAIRAYENFGFRIDHIEGNNIRMTLAL